MSTLLSAGLQLTEVEDRLVWSLNAVPGQITAKLSYHFLVDTHLTAWIVGGTRKFGFGRSL